METVKLRIDGMHCGGCEEIVRHVLEGEPGVMGCSVSREEGRARVAIDGARMTGRRLTEALRGAGYTASVIDD